MRGSVHGRARSFLLLFTVLGDTYPQKHTVKHSVASSNTEKYNAFNKFSDPGPFFGRTKPPEAAAGHDTLVLRTKTLLASMAHECTDRTSRRAEIPPPEEAALCAAPQRGAAAFGGPPSAVFCGPKLTFSPKCGKSIKNQHFLSKMCHVVICSPPRVVKAHHSQLNGH